LRDVRLVVAGDAEAAARAAAECLAEAAGAGCEIALSGGSTPRRAYELAAGLQADWSRAGLWWGDERCVPPDDPRSNFRLAREALLDRLVRAPRAVHRIEGEQGAEEAARRYELALGGVGFDLVLLGIGDDGHTASLFPGSAALDERRRLALPVAAAGVDRVTLTLPALLGAAQIVFLAVGTGKAKAVRRAFAEAPTREVPASLVRSGRGETVAILDRAAAAELDRIRSST